MRVFYCLCFDESTLDSLVAARDALQSVALGGRFTPRDNLHMTELFVGETMDIQRLGEIASECFDGGFEICFKGYTVLSRGLYTAAAQSAEAAALHSRLLQRVRAAGLPCDARLPFRAHVTLARDVSGLKEKLPELEPFTAYCGSLCLMHTSHTRAGVRYDVVQRVGE